MNNLYKYRAWHKELKQMLEVVGFHWYDTGELNQIKYLAKYGEDPSECLFDEAEVELMQWTGLQSADAVDVYQGDILAYDHGGGIDTFVIERCIHSNQLIAKYLYMNNDWEHLDDAPVECSKIIGNIYENSELLKPTS